MTKLRSAMIAGVAALSCLGMSSQPAVAQMHGGGGFNGGHGGFNGGHGGFGNRGFCCGNRFFFGFGFPGFGFGGYPYYPYYPAYYPPYYPYYPPYPAYPAAASAYPAAPPAYPAAASVGARRAVDPTTVLVQAELQRQGYDVGPVDGLLGPRTKAAIREYEQRNGLPADGLPSHSLLDHMQAHPTG